MKTLAKDVPASVPVSTFTCAFPVVSEGSPLLLFGHVPIILHPLLILYLFPPSFLEELPIFPSTQYHFMLWATVVRILLCLEGVNLTRDL